MQFLFMCLFSLGIVAADQLTKYLTVTHIPLYGKAPLLPGVVQLTYVQNTGAAWSILSGQQWLFVLIFLVLTALLLWEYFKKPLPFTRLERWLLAAVYGGGLGNMIDRVRLGYVVDMIEVTFMNFAVFNVADCFVVCGAILLVIYAFFFDKPAKKEHKDDTAG